MADALDVLLPMVYPSHFADGTYGLEEPNAEPYAVVRRAVEDGLRRNRAIPNAAKIRPWLQAFTLGRPRYESFNVSEQLRAVHVVGLSEWILWNAASRYQRAALDSIAALPSPPQ
jgi:hypothetical protein